MSDQWMLLRDAVERQGAGDLYADLCNGLIQARARRVTLHPEDDDMRYTLHPRDEIAEEKRRAQGAADWLLTLWLVPPELWVANRHLAVDIEHASDPQAAKVWPDNMSKPSGWPFGAAYLHDLEIAIAQPMRTAIRRSDTDIVREAIRAKDEENVPYSVTFKKFEKAGHPVFKEGGIFESQRDRLYARIREEKARAKR